MNALSSYHHAGNFIWKEAVFNTLNLKPHILNDLYVHSSADTYHSDFQLDVISQVTVFYIRFGGGGGRRQGELYLWVLLF